MSRDRLRITLAGLGGLLSVEPVNVRELGGHLLQAYRAAVKAGQDPGLAIAEELDEAIRMKGPVGAVLEALDGPLLALLAGLLEQALAEALAGAEAARGQQEGG